MCKYLTVWPEFLCSTSVLYELPSRSWCIQSVPANLWPGSGWSWQLHAAAQLSVSLEEPPDQLEKTPWSFQSSTGLGLWWAQAGPVCTRPGPDPGSEAREAEGGTCWRTPRTSIWGSRFSAGMTEKTAWCSFWQLDSSVIVFCEVLRSCT